MTTSILGSPTEAERRLESPPADAETRGAEAKITLIRRAPDRRQSSWPLASWSLALLAVMTLAKLALLPYPVSNFAEFVRWLARLAIVTAPDGSFVAGMSLVCYGFEWACRGFCDYAAARAKRRKRGQFASACAIPLAVAMARGARGLAFTLFLLAGVYAVASVPMYRVLMTPVSIRLLSFAGGPALMWSSITPFLSTGVVVSLLAAPLAIWFSPPAAEALSRRVTRIRFGWKIRAGAILLLGLAGFICDRYVQANWTDPNRWERRIARSAHATLLGSCLEELAKERPFTIEFSFAQGNTDDFEREFREELPARSIERAFPPGVERPRNAILIVLESVGTEYVGCYGSRFDTTPRLDALAAQQGWIFDSIYVQATSSCKSLVALTASVYPRPDWLLIVRDNPGFDVPTIPQTLSKDGYRSCFAHSGYWSWKGRDRYLRERGTDAVLDASNIGGESVNSWGIDDRKMFEAMLAWIDKDRQRPFFAFAYTIETHHPYVASAPLHDFGVDDPELNRYLNAVRGADRQIARLMDELRRRGLAESTVVAVTSDHGESFGQHGQRIHSFGLYEQAVHVPLVILHPALAKSAGHVPTIGQHIDIGPTLMEMLGREPPAEWQGRSLCSPRRSPRAYFLSVGNEVALGVRDGDFKYHYYVDSKREELFDVRLDPGESRNLAETRPEVCQAFRARLAGWTRFQREFLAEHGAR